MNRKANEILNCRRPHSLKATDFHLASPEALMWLKHTSTPTLKEETKATETALPTHSFPKQKLPASATQAKWNPACKVSISYGMKKWKEASQYLWCTFLQVFDNPVPQAKGYYRVNIIINIILLKGHRRGHWQSVKERYQKVMITWLHIAVLKWRTSWRSSILITSWRISW